MTDFDIENKYIIEERADYVDEKILETQTVQSGEFYKKIHTALISPGIKLIVGPRGCGKTHMMRYAWLECKNDESSPLALYVSFNKYFKLEPLLKAKPNAVDLFHKWVLSKILLSAYEIACALEDEDELDLSSILIANKSDIESLIIRLEQGLSPSITQEILFEKISVSSTISSLNNLSDWLERKKVIILLDDAAITLTPEYLHEFFDIVRSLKTSRISLKASVYPGTTEYGPKFHAAHDAETIDAWIPVNSADYSSIMESIATARFKEFREIPNDISELFKYASFGIPRSYLMMLREFVKSAGSTNQQKINHILEKYSELRKSEYRSLKDKLPRLHDIVTLGESLLEILIRLLKDANLKLENEKQVVVGIDESQNSYFKRLTELLIETGLLYRLPAISHGDERVYERYIPHYALLISEKVFSSGSRGFSPSLTIEYITRKNAKHPIRRNINTLFNTQQLTHLKLTLPPCSVCNTNRMTENQKFCHQCGNPLIDESAYNKCMSIPLTKVPNLTSWQISKLGELGNIKKIGDLLSLQDPGGELRKIHMIGPVKANHIVRTILLQVEEYLS